MKICLQNYTLSKDNWEDFELSVMQAINPDFFKLIAKSIDIFGMLAIVIFTGDHYCILIDEDTKSKYRFALMHEIGHIELDHLNRMVIEKSVNGYYSYGGLINEDIERELAADKYAMEHTSSQEALTFLLFLSTKIEDYFIGTVYYTRYKKAIDRRLKAVMDVHFSGEDDGSNQEKI